MKKVYVIPILVLIIFTALGFVASAKGQSEITIVHTRDGFVPSEITIKKGQKITFVTDTENRFWPASNYHPSHGVYSEFDPKRQLLPEESWSFIFDTPGIWEFHDHMTPHFKGKISVLGKRGESAAECIKNSTDTIKAACWEAEFKDIILSDGLDAAFDTFVEMYEVDDLFKRNCHDITHYIGSIAYEYFVQTGETVVRPETQFCGYGFYHGFIETILEDRGPDFYAEGRRYCELLEKDPSFVTKSQKDNATGACTHGFGHAIFDSIDGQFWGDEKSMVEESIAACEQTFSSTHDLSNCSAGVFNSLANAYSAKDYELSFRHEDPTGICKIQKTQYKDRCYTEIAVGYVRNQKFDRATSLAFFETLRPEEGTEFSIFGFMDDEVRRNTVAAIDMQSTQSFCASLSYSKDQKACIRGVIVGLRNGGVPGEEQGEKYEFCDTFEKESSLEKYCRVYAAP